MLPAIYDVKRGRGKLKPLRVGWDLNVFNGEKYKSGQDPPLGEEANPIALSSDAFNYSHSREISC